MSVLSSCIPIYLYIHIYIYIYTYIYIYIPAEFSPSTYLLLIHRFAIAKRQFWLKKGVSEREGLTFLSTTLSAFFLLEEAQSRIKTVAWCCLMNVAVVFNNSRGFSHRHWNDLTYRNIFRFTFTEPFVVGILLGTVALNNFHQLSSPPHPSVASRMCGSCRRTCSGVASRMCGSCRRTGSGVASRMCVSANER